MAIKTTQGYSRTQIILHWVVFVLVALQFIGHEAMIRVYRPEEGVPLAGSDPLMAQLHVIGGAAIFLFAAWRIYLKVTRGAPELPEKEPAALKLVANGTHIVLYLLVLGMPISGAAAWFGQIELAAAGHSFARIVLLLLVLLHVVGALAQHFWFRTDVMRRMVKAQS
ncbi:MAG: cytochrome b/b6 domain-containing protein [Rhizobiaceae bacterium]